MYVHLVIMEFSTPIFPRSTRTLGITVCAFDESNKMSETTSLSAPSIPLAPGPAMAAGTPPSEGPLGTSGSPGVSTPGASPVGSHAADAMSPGLPLNSSFGSPGGLANGGASPQALRANKFAFASPGSVNSPNSPHHTQGAPGHVAKMVDWVEHASTGEQLLSSEKTNSSGKKRTGRRSSLTSSVVGGFAAATSGALERLRASRNAPETPVLPPKVRRSIRSENLSNEEIEEEVSLAQRMSPLAMSDVETNSPYEHKVDPGMVSVTVDPYDFDAFAEQFEERVVSPVCSAVPETPHSPEREQQASQPPVFLNASSSDMPPVHDVKSPSLSPSLGPALVSSPQLDERKHMADDVLERALSPEIEALRASAQVAAGTAVSPVSETVPSPKRRDVDENAVPSTRSPAASENDAPQTHSNVPMSDAAVAIATAPVTVISQKPTVPLRPSSFVNVLRKSDTNKPLPAGGPITSKPHVQIQIPKSSAPVPAPSATKKRNESYHGTVMTPLPISKSVLDRIDALGPEMQPAQKYILLLGIALDFYAKTQLIRELRRFALMGDNGGWAWFTFVFLFFLLSGSCTCAYWLLHYPMPDANDEKDLNGTRVFGFTKLDFKKTVRNVGAVCCMLQLGTAFAAWRALRVKDIRQRKAEMDLRGMQLVDTVFLLLPVAILQAYVGIVCSSPELTCPGRNGFDALLFCAVLGAITSATLCFVSLDLHEKPPSITWSEYWKAHKPHLSEMTSKAIFKFLELSARISLIALFAAVNGGWIFFIFAMHVAFVLLGLRFWNIIITGGVPDRKVWDKFVKRDLRIQISEKHKWWPERLVKTRTFTLPTLDDTKLLVAAMLWPPSMFISNAVDTQGRFWWRSKSCPRRSFLSVDRSDAIFPLPLFAALMTFEACLMFLLIGVKISTKTHYHAYFAVTAIVNMAWLMSVTGWISSAALWNPFLAEGPKPLNGYVLKGNQGSNPQDPVNQTAWSGWHGPGAADDDDEYPNDTNSFNTFSSKKVLGANVAASMAAPGVFSPSGRTPGGRSGRRGSNIGVAASIAVGPMAVVNQEKPAARALLFPDDEEAARKEKREKHAADERAAVLKAEVERKAAKVEVQRLEIARLDALRLEEAKAAMKREKELAAKKMEEEAKKINVAKPPTVPSATQPPYQPLTVGPLVTINETSAEERRQSGGLFGRPGIVVRESQDKAL